MKKFLTVLLLLSVMFWVCACKDDFLPDTLTLNGTEYKKSSIDYLYPTEQATYIGQTRVFARWTFEEYSGETRFAVAYDLDANPVLYFPQDSYERQSMYYGDGENFDYYCLKGDLYDTAKQKRTLLSEIDYGMYEGLTDFCEKHAYNPLASAQDESGIQRLPYAEQNEEIRFYKISKDGMFTSTRGYVFIVYDAALYFLSRYDYADERAPVMLVYPLEASLSGYFLPFTD